MVKEPLILKTVELLAILLQAFNSVGLNSLNKHVAFLQIYFLESFCLRTKLVIILIP